MVTRRDGRSPTAIAFGWASRIITIAAGMVIPGVIGFGVDRWLGTLVLFTLLGFGLGITAGIWQLVRLTEIEDIGAGKDGHETGDE